MTQLIDFTPEFLADIKNIRRDIHAHPEVAFEEQRTADLIAAKLEGHDIRVIRNLGKTGIVGIIESGSSKRAIGLRADIDALPMQELNRFGHASTHEGKMHACGHDGHTAMLLGAAIHLARTRHFDGTVYVIFQPAEESYGGALTMIEEGLFERFHMDAVFGLHNWPDYDAGEFAVCKGPMMASSNSFSLSVLGRGGHAGQPNHTIDPLMTALQIAQGWQTIITRNKSPVDAAVLSITQIHGGSAYNVVPDDATMAGTVRTFSAETLDLIEKRMLDIAGKTAAAFDCSVEFDFQRNYPPLINHVKETDLAVDVMQSIVGSDRVHANAAPTMTAEDFSFMLQKKPGCYVFLGNGPGNHREAHHGEGPCRLHNPSYDFNDNIIPLGMTYWIRLVEKYLS